MKNKQIIIFCFFIIAETSALHADFVCIPASAFHQGDNGSASYEISADGYIYCPITPTTLFARVVLPHDTWIKNIRVFYYDNDISNDISVYLDRVDFHIYPTKYTIFSVSSDSSSPNMRFMIDSSVTPPLKGWRGVGNDSYQMFLRLDLAGGSDHRLYGVTIEYAER